MDNTENGEDQSDLLQVALSESGLGDLTEFDEIDEPQEHGPVQVETGTVPLAQSTPVRAGPSQFITVRTDPGQGPAHVISTLSTAAGTPDKMVQSSNLQAARTPVTTKIYRVPSVQRSTAGNLPTTFQLANGQQVVQRVIPGTTAPNRFIAISPAANSNSAAVTKNILVNTGTRSVTPQNVISTPQGAKASMARRILVAHNGQPKITAINDGSVVLASVTQPGTLVRTVSSPQLIQSSDGIAKVVINQGNGRVLQVRPQSPLTTNGISLTTRTIRVAGPRMRGHIVQPSSVGSPRTVVRTISASPMTQQTSLVQPSTGQLRPVGQARTGPQVIISQPGLSGAKVISASPSPGPSTGSLHHSFSAPALTKEGSRSRSNSPVIGLGNIPAVVSQKVTVRNYAGPSSSSREVSWSQEDMQQRAFNNASNAQQTLPRKGVDMAEDAEEETEELGHAETYAEYKPRKMALGEKHPDQVVESSSLSSVEPPDVRYQLHIPEEVMDECKLSALQLEAITYACQRHEVILPSGERAGYLVGDGAGVGKGRISAGVIFENYLRGNKKAIWLSISNDLKVDADRDLKDIGAAKINVFALKNLKYAKISSEENGSIKKGVIFVTYSCLIGESQSQSKYKTRMKQLLKWCGKDFDGPIIFDECHKAKNLCPTGSSKPTKTGLAVMELQNRLPKARVIYASATGATEPKNMAYMTRLGLWGKGTPFKEFTDFINSVEKRGVGAMELVAMDMKLRGMYIARQLSFKGVSFRIEEIPMTDDFKKIYNQSVDLWMEAREMFQKAADHLRADHRNRKSMWGQFWSAHQRFFKYMCLAAKVDHCVNLTRQAVKDGKCVVIGLQSTGEARTQEMVELEGNELSDFISTAKGVLTTLVEKHFPATDRNKTLGLLGLGGLYSKSNSLDFGFKRKAEESKGQGSSKRSKMEEDDSEDEQSETLSSFSDSSSDCSSASDSDDDTNPFGSGRDSEDEDPWVKQSKKKKKKKGAKEKKKKEKKKKKKKKDSDDEEDEMTDRMLANINFMSKSSSLAGFGNSEDNDPDNARGRHMALQIKMELVNLVDQVADNLPANTLDQLIDNLGGPDMVAEMTGRKGRVVQNDDGIQYESRTDSEANMDYLNLREKERFMYGQKDIAIISEAASSGISLQADRRVVNQKRRVHITLELPWSADRAIQQFGRTHRSNQVSAPEYVFLISDLAGERRFASTVAKRLESLGALTHGDRRATESRDLSRFNIDNRFGRTALETVLKSVLGMTEPLVEIPAGYTKEKFFPEVKKALEGVGLVTVDRNNIATLEKDYGNISKFLNRLLGMPVDLQNALFEYFNDTLSTIILEAKRSGRWDMGILDLGSGQEVVQRLETKVFVGNTTTNTAKTELSTIQVERGMSWDDASNIWRKCKTTEEGFYLSTQERNQKRTAILVVLQGRNKKREKVYTVYRPNTGLQTRAETLEEIKKKYKKVLPDEAEFWWNDLYVSSARVCIHAYWSGNCRKANMNRPCEVGLRTRQYHVLSGSVLSVWTSVESVLSSMPGGNMSKMQIVRLKTGDGQKIVGSLIPSNCVAPLVNVLTQKSAKNYVETHHQTLQSAINGLASSLPSTPSSSSSSSSATAQSSSQHNRAARQEVDGDMSQQAPGASAPPMMPEQQILSMPTLVMD